MLRAFFLLGLLVCNAFAFSIPPNEGFVTDTASVLSKEEGAHLETMLRQYALETSNEIAVLIVSSLGGEPIAEVSVQVGREWGIGTEVNDNGILLLISVTDRELFIATGYGLEGAVPDIVAKGVVEEEILPRFREGEYALGIERGVAALQKHIAGEYTQERYVETESEFGAWSGIMLIFIFIALEWFLAVMARTKSWWLGGIFGGLAGALLAFLLGWWLSIPILVALGLLLDFIVSRDYKSRGKTHWWAGGGWGPGGSGGGFSGFSGGNFGGGGAIGRW